MLKIDEQHAEIVSFLQTLSELSESLTQKVQESADSNESSFDLIINEAVIMADNLSGMQMLLTKDEGGSYTKVTDDLRRLIKEGIIQPSDKYLRLWRGASPVAYKNPQGSIVKGEWRVDAIYWSDSAVFYEIYNNGGKDMDTVDYLNACDAAGAYTKTAWGRYAVDKSVTPKDIMESFRINEHIRPSYLATGTKEECDEAIKVVLEWNCYHIKSLNEMLQDKKLNFIRVNRKKGEIESTRCMNGDCIGVIFAKETSF